MRRVLLILLIFAGSRELPVSPRGSKIIENRCSVAKSNTAARTDAPRRFSAAPIRILFHNRLFNLLILRRGGSLLIILLICDDLRAGFKILGKRLINEINCEY